MRFKGYRVVKAVMHDGVPVELISMWSKERMPFNKVLASVTGIYVGTKEIFCQSYYTNLVDKEEGEAELMLELDIEERDLRQGDKERFMDDSYMGSEVIAFRVIVLRWRLTNATDWN